MAILGTLIKKGIKLRENLDQDYLSPFEQQKIELRELLLRAKDTEFGKFYGFDNILKHFRLGHTNFYQRFNESVPIHDYNKMYKDWWKLSLKGVRNIAWPGKSKYFALSSGTSEAASKHIPITKDMTKAIQRTSIRQIISLSRYDLPSRVFESGILMVGGSTHLSHQGSYFEGDLSGIQAARLPFWFQHFYKPGKRIAKTRSWEEKLDKMVRKAPDWNIGIIVGVPAWIQILLERIIERYGLKHIHDIWPNLRVYVHGGVSIEPYRNGLEKLFGKPMQYIETYLASEGFIAYQALPNHKSMRLVLNNGIFFEFIPFNDQNFTTSGDVRPEAQSLLIDEVEENKDYAILISTCAGAWRYLIGDVIRFTSVRDAEIVITGRTRHYLSLCGEHLSVDNMNRAIELVSRQLNISIPEYTVAGIPHGNLFAHHWFVGTDDRADPAELRQLVDQYLSELNDDYRVERSAALREVVMEVLPLRAFYQFMEMKGKSGGQNKFPRVLKKTQLDDWKQFLQNQAFHPATAS
ncbi:MAG: GH3 auxin-responsive promoter family protein [Cyclobacteriaceae bacterium]|nr:GH3 auxin-responsive promoter family protein [Cyclobacteriaceae bacterium]